jgi:hypothetical protein
VRFEVLPDPRLVRRRAYDGDSECDDEGLETVAGLAGVAGDIVFAGPDRLAHLGLLAALVADGRLEGDWAPPTPASTRIRRERSCRWR